MSIRQSAGAIRTSERASGASKKSAKADSKSQKPKEKKKEERPDLDRDSFARGLEYFDEDENRIPVERRIFLPLTWARLTSGVRIIDLHEELYEHVLNLMRRNFIREEPLCKSLRMWEDEESLASLLSTVTIWLKDGTSLAAVREGSNELLGALVTRVVHLLDHTRTFSRIRPTKCGQIVQGENFHKIMTFRCHMHKSADLFDKFDVQSYLRLYCISVRPMHRGKGIGMALLQSAIQLAKALGQKVIMGIFTTMQLQCMAAKMGMYPVYEVYYAQWQQDSEVVFDDPGPGNYSAMVMTKKIHIPKVTSAED